MSRLSSLERAIGKKIAHIGSEMDDKGILRILFSDGDTIDIIARVRTESTHIVPGSAQVISFSIVP